MGHRGSPPPGRRAGGPPDEGSGSAVSIGQCLWRLAPPHGPVKGSYPTLPAPADVSSRGLRPSPQKFIIKAPGPHGWQGENISDAPSPSLTRGCRRSQSLAVAWRQLCQIFSSVNFSLCYENFYPRKKK